MPAVPLPFLHFSVRRGALAKLHASNFLSESAREFVYIAHGNNQTRACLCELISSSSSSSRSRGSWRRRLNHGFISVDLSAKLNRHGACLRRPRPTSSPGIVFAVANYYQGIANCSPARRNRASGDFDRLSITAPSASTFAVKTGIYSSVEFAILYIITQSLWYKQEPGWAALPILWYLSYIRDVLGSAHYAYIFWRPTPVYR